MAPKQPKEESLKALRQAMKVVLKHDPSGRAIYKLAQSVVFPLQPQQPREARPLALSHNRQISTGTERTEASNYSGEELEDEFSRSTEDPSDDVLHTGGLNHLSVTDSPRKDSHIEKDGSGWAPINQNMKRPRPLEELPVEEYSRESDPKPTATRATRKKRTAR